MDRSHNRRLNEQHRAECLDAPKVIVIVTLNVLGRSFGYLRASSISAGEFHVLGEASDEFPLYFILASDLFELVWLKQFQPSKR